MVATDEHNSVVGFVHPLAIPLYNVVVVPFSLKSEAAIASNDDNSVCHLILDTYFVYEQVEVAVNVPAHDDTPCLRELVYPFVAIHIV